MGPDHTLNGGGGDDFIFGDINSFTFNVAGNNTFGAAFGIDNPFIWSTSENPLVEDSAVPALLYLDKVKAGSRSFILLLWRRAIPLRWI